MLQDVLDGKATGRFMEGMGCNGGCVGGPKTMIKMEEGRDILNNFAETSEVKISLDNPPMKSYLSKLGFKDPDSPKSKESFGIFERNF
jgi:iron only hydrogenase large subunit-like protein